MTSKTETKTAPAAVAKLVEQVTALDVEIEERQTKRKQLVDTIAQLVDDVGTYAAGSAQVQVKYGGRTLDADRFRKQYPVEKYPELYKAPAPDTTSIKHELGGKVLNTFYGAPGARQVIVK